MQEMPEWKHPTGGQPHTVAIVALGASRVDYDAYQLQKSHDRIVDEVWAVNRGLRLHNHDLAFVLDDLRREAFFDPAYGEAIKAHTKPIITSQLHSEFGNHILEYPLEQLALKCYEAHVRTYLHNSIPMMIAYAWFIGVKRLIIFGADYTRDDGIALEPSRSNVEYWIGVCERSGMDVGVGPNARLLGLRDFPAHHVYGYDKLDYAHGQLKRAAERFTANRGQEELDRQAEV